jgi:hypothetical protein
MSVNEILSVVRGAKWVSLSTEIRPSILKTESGNIKPFYCTREFEFPADDRFTLKFSNFADPFGRVPLAEMNMAGQIRFGKPHPLVDGAYEIDYVADQSFAITLLNEQLAAVLNRAFDPSVGEWVVNSPKEVLGKSVPVFGLKVNEHFREYDLIYINGDMLFNGARHIDGRPFDTPESRPTNLQIPLKKVSS